MAGAGEWIAAVLRVWPHRPGRGRICRASAAATLKCSRDIHLGTLDEQGRRPYDSSGCTDGITEEMRMLAMKKITGSLMALALAAVLAFAPAVVSARAEGETAPEATATAETATVIPDGEAAAEATATPAPTAAPVLLATVNGVEIYDNDPIIQDLIAYYGDYGYDVTDPALLVQIKEVGLNWAIDGVLYRQKAQELNVPEMTEEQKKNLEAEAKTDWDSAVEYYATSLGGLTETSTEEEKANARVQALAYIESNFGVTEEKYISDYVENSRDTTLRENVQNAVLGEITVSEEDITAHFNEIVDEDRDMYEGNVGMYEYYTQYMRQPSFYIPEGYRGITHILLKVDDEILNRYQDLSAKLASQEAAAAATAAPETDPAPAATEAADAAPTPETTEEPVTAEMVEEARKAVLDNVQSKVDEIMAKYKAGTPFADLIAEYGNDPGMTVEPNKTDGYAVHAESILWDPAFVKGAMTLQKVGDVSEPVVGNNGVHILHYTRDIPAGAVEMTPEIHDQLKEEIMTEAREAAVTAMTEEWRKTAEIVYTEEGQAIVKEVADMRAEEETATGEQPEAEPAAETADSPAAEEENAPAQGN